MHIENEAYSLLRIFDVNIPLLYGEGRKAFNCLQQEILSSTGDSSLLCWIGHMGSEDYTYASLTLALARSLQDFINQFYPIW
jgi:hypothetical protein